MKHSSVSAPMPCESYRHRGRGYSRAECEKKVQVTKPTAFAISTGAMEGITKCKAQGRQSLGFLLNLPHRHRRLVVLFRLRRGVGRVDARAKLLLQRNPVNDLEKRLGTGFNNIGADGPAIDDPAVVLGLDVGLALGVFADRNTADTKITQSHFD